jgi:hypothetical protein
VGAATVAGYRHHVFGRRFNTVGLVFTVLLVFSDCSRLRPPD